MPGAISGLISGLQTDDIIAKMVEYAKRPITILQNKQANYTAQLASWQEANARLLAFRMKAGSLSNGFSFKDKTATSSDETLLAVSSTIDAAPGSYSIRVDRLAQAEQRLSQGFADTDKATVGSGAITIGSGSTTQTITVDATNNTLSGLRDAINRAGVGVNASIVDLGSGTTHDYRLQLTGTQTGASNAITWTSNLTGGADPTWSVSTAAQDAQITVGPTGNTTTITKSSNKISDVYPGLTLNLKAADAGKTVTVTVAPDMEAVKGKIKDFIDQYNGMIDFINAQFSFDTETQQSGVLFGDFALQNVQQDLRAKVMAPVPGLPAAMSTLSAIGITTGPGDKLVLDEAALDTALSSDPGGVMKLFAVNGESTDYSVSYVGAGSDTKASGAAAGYKVRIDRVATQARVTAGTAQTAALTANETLTINGTPISLTAGMTPEQVLDAINAETAKTGITASRTGADGTGAGGYLTLTRTAYGPSYKITAVSSASNGGAAPTTDTSGLGRTQVTESAAAGETGAGSGAAGQDVAGAFGVTVNGSVVWEEATGVGQMLTGKAGNANTDGLQVKATSTTTGEHGTVTLTRGVGGIFDNLLDYLTRPEGLVGSAQDTLNKQIQDLKDQISAQTDRLTKYSDKIRAQFNNLESRLGELQSQGEYLTSQFSAMNKSK